MVLRVAETYSSRGQHNGDQSDAIWKYVYDGYNTTIDPADRGVERLYNRVLEGLKNEAYRQFLEKSFVQMRDDMVNNPMPPEELNALSPDKILFNDAEKAVLRLCGKSTSEAAAWLLEKLKVHFLRLPKKPAFVVPEPVEGGVEAVKTAPEVEESAAQAVREKIVGLRKNYNLKDALGEMDYVRALEKFMAQIPESDRKPVFREICRAHLVLLVAQDQLQAGTSGTIRIEGGASVETNATEDFVEATYNGLKFKYTRAELAN